MTQNPEGRLVTADVAYRDAVEADGARRLRRYAKTWRINRLGARDQWEVGFVFYDAACPLRRDRLRPVTASSGGELSKNIRCFSNIRRLPSSASSSDSAISEPWPVSSICLTIARW
jgi:hypothetical protein